MNASSIVESHMRPASWKAFRGLDALLLTTLSRTPDKKVDEMCIEIGKTTGNTLIHNGNVLFPISSVGYVLDLLEIVFRGMEAVSRRSQPRLQSQQCAAKFRIVFLAIFPFSSSRLTHAARSHMQTFSPSGSPKVKQRTFLPPRSRLHSARYAILFLIFVR